MSIRRTTGEVVKDAVKEVVSSRGWALFVAWLLAAVAVALIFWSALKAAGPVASP